MRKRAFAAVRKGVAKERSTTSFTGRALRSRQSLCVEEWSSGGGVRALWSVPFGELRADAPSEVFAMSAETFAVTLTDLYISKVKWTGGPLRRPACGWAEPTEDPACQG